MDPALKKLLDELQAAPAGQKKGIVSKIGKLFSSATSVAATATGASVIGEIASGLNPATLTEFAKTQQRVLFGFTEIVERADQFAKSQNAFFQAGYTGQMFDFSEAISAASRASLDLNGNLQGAQAVMQGFQRNSMALAVANEQFTKTLMNSAVVLERAGFEMDTFADIVDSAAFAFNKNEEEISGLTATLINVQKQIPVSGRTLAENFRFAQKEFAYQSGRMMENFVGLQKMSVTTGVSFTDLAGAFGDSMDSFQGSAQMAGSLNQILGKSVFNSIELLNMTETERATKIRSAILESGRSVEDMGKFELKALQKTLGFSLEDTRKFLRGDLKIDEADALKAIRSQNPSKMIMDNSKDLSKELDFLRDRIKSVRPPFDNLAISLSKLTREQGIDRINRIFANLANVEDMRLTPEQIAFAGQARLMGSRITKSPAEGAGSLIGLPTGDSAVKAFGDYLGKLLDEKLKPYDPAQGGDPTMISQLVFSVDGLTKQIGDMISKLPTMIAAALE